MDVNIKFKFTAKEQVPHEEFTSHAAPVFCFLTVIAISDMNVILIWSECNSDFDVGSSGGIWYSLLEVAAV